MSHLLGVALILLCMGVIKPLPTTHIPFITGSLIPLRGSPTNCHLGMGVPVMLFCLHVSKPPCSLHQ